MLFALMHAVTSAPTSITACSLFVMFSRQCFKTGTCVPGGLICFQPVLGDLKWLTFQNLLYYIYLYFFSDYSSTSISKYYD